jgi:AraC family transcriptional activator FtrA
MSSGEDCPKTCPAAALRFRRRWQEHGRAGRRAHRQNSPSQIGTVTQSRKRAQPNVERRRLSLLAIDTYLRYCFSLETPPRVSELARLLDISRGTLLKQIRDLQSTTPARYLKAQQLLCAKHLLSRSLSVEDVAHHAGYGTKRTFQRSFHAATGLTPAAFRRREQNVTPERV